MDLIQTRTQNIFDRLYQTAIYLLLPQIVLLLFVGLSAMSIHFWTVFFIFLGINICAPIWLLVFNSGSSKLDAFSVKLDDAGIHVSSYGAIKSITSASYRGYRATGIFPKQIVILGADNKRIAFSYYALNAKQRRKLFDVLSSKQR